MSKFVTAVLAALMLAGALSAVTDATSVPSFHAAVVIGEGSAPLPLMLPPDGSNNASNSTNRHF